MRVNVLVYGDERRPLGLKAMQVFNVTEHHIFGSILVGYWTTFEPTDSPINLLCLHG
jgi:hypothetical protein